MRLWERGVSLCNNGSLFNLRSMAGMASGTGILVKSADMS